VGRLVFPWKRQVDLDHFIW